MQIGLCTELAKIAWVRDLGFDYIEVGASQVAEYSDEEFEMRLAEAKSVGLPVCATNGLLPWQLQFFGPTGADPAFPGYFRKTFGRLERLGVKLSVFGCGSSRNCPEGVSYSEGVDRFVEIFRMAVAEAESHGIALAMEALKPEETNIGNYVSECAALVRLAGVSAVHGVTADWHHMAVAREEPSEASRTGMVRHAHIAAGVSRAIPASGDGEPYAEFLAAVRAAGVDHVSIETETCDEAAYRAAIPLLRSL